MRQHFLFSSLFAAAALLAAGCGIEASGGTAGHGKVRMALTNEAESESQVHLLVTGEASGQVEADQVLTIAAYGSLVTELDLSSGEHIVDIEVMDSAEAKVEGSG